MKKYQKQKKQVRAKSKKTKVKKAKPTPQEKERQREKIKEVVQGTTTAFNVIKIVLLVFGSLISLALLSALIYAVVTVVKGLKEFIV